MHVELKIKNNAIHCDSCETRIQKVLEDKPGIIKAIADHMIQEVQIYFDEDQITIQDIEQTLERLGYPVNC